MNYIAEDVNKIDIPVGSSALANLATNNPVENLKLAYLSTLVDQNWLIIKKLSDISNSIENNSDSTTMSGTGEKITQTIATSQQLEVRKSKLRNIKVLMKETTGFKSRGLW